MKESEDEDFTQDFVQINDTVREIFDGIFDGPMSQFKVPLESIEINEYGLVQRDGNELNTKVMSHAKTFSQAVAASFGTKHAEAAKHIEGSTCDLFLHYIYERLDESLLGQDPFNYSCEKTKKLIADKILRIKSELETKPDEQPANKSDLEVLISQTDLFDPIHIRHALLCCQVANDCDNPENSQNFLDSLEKEHLLSGLSVSYENDKVPKYVMARCGDVLYVSFKRLQTSNFGATEKSYRGEICSRIEETAKKIPLEYFAREIIQDKRIVFTGHSSGGAIASLVMISLLEKFMFRDEEYRKFHFKCITFGLMPMADVHFKRFVESIPGAEDCFFHIVQKNDIIPKLFGSCNMKSIQGKLWELVERILCPESSFEAPIVKLLLSMLISHDGEYFREVVGFKHLDIFGTYYILDTSKTEAKYSVLSAKEAAYALTINENENLRHLLSQYLINHKLERYAHEVELAFIQDIPDLKKFYSKCNTTIADDITPKITEVQFERIGEEVVAKIAGINMWFVYNVSFEGVNGDGKDLEVNVMKSLESEVQIIMRETKIVHDEQVTVRVKTHFQNSQYLPATEVVAQTTTYPVTRRQQQIANHRPREVMELAYLSALLECYDESCSSKRFDAIKTFFENAVSVVPLESLFYGIAKGTPEVMLQCCEILLCGSIPTISQPSEFFLTGMEDACLRIKSFLSVIDTTHGRSSEEIYRKPLNQPGYRRMDSLASRYHQHRRLSLMAVETRPFRPLQSNEYISLLLNKSIRRIEESLEIYQPKRRKQSNNCATLCNINLEVIYPSTETQEKRECKTTYCKSPVTLLTEGREELGKFSEEFIAEQTGHTEGTSSTTNCRMLTVLTKLRNEFETCSTLLTAFMEPQVHLPLEIGGGGNNGNLSVWSWLISLPEYLKHMIKRLSKDFGQFFIDFSRDSRDTDGNSRFSFEHEFPGYDEKLEFLVTSMKRSTVYNKNYVSYSLERQLEVQCKERNIFHDTPVSEILAQWNATFEFENLALIQNQWRPLVARWIKLSLMINNLRESLASQTAIGVIGLVHSGKSKFVRTMFGKKTVTGTTDQKRTTVPLIYNLGEDIEGMDVIDFPGVEDRDKSIPELAELLLSLTRIIVFVVEYKRAYTESTKEWLSILEKKNVPVLICLNFADKLFAELMGMDGGCDDEKIKTRIEEELNHAKEYIGQPESGHQRDFKFTVFALDNDSNFNTEEGKKKLRKAGLNDELDVGRWIAEKLHDYDQNEVSQNVIKFIDQKEKSTLNPCRRGRQMPTVAAEGKFDPEEQLKLDNNADADLKGKYMNFLVDNPCSGGKNHSTQGDCRAKAPIHIAEPLQDNTEYSPKITLHPENGVSSIQGIPENDDIIQSQNEEGSGSPETLHDGESPQEEYNVSSDQDDTLESINRTSEYVIHRCELFEKTVESLAEEKLKINQESAKDPKGGKVTKFVGDAAAVTTVIVGLAGGITIAVSVATFGATAVVPALVTGAVLAAKIRDRRNIQSKAKVVEHMVTKTEETNVLSYLNCVVKDVAKELSRIFEYQLLQLKGEKEIKILAQCAVKLMFDLKNGDTFDRNTLLKKVLQDGNMKKREKLATKTKNKKWSAPDVFRKPGLRRITFRKDGVKFEYFVKPSGACDVWMYGYRCQFLELKKFNSQDGAGETPPTDETRNEDNCAAFCKECSSNYINYPSGHYFSESDIDAQYTDDPQEDSTYYPVNILLQCPNVLDCFQQLQETKLPLATFLKSKLGLPGDHIVLPVYRPHSPGKVFDLQKSDFTGSDFSHCDFTDCCLKNCDFAKCVMLFAKLAGAKFSGSKFCDTFISHSNLKKVMADRCEWTKTSLLYSSVDGGHLESVVPSIAGNCLKGTNICKAFTTKNDLNRNEEALVQKNVEGVSGTLAAKAR